MPVDWNERDYTPPDFDRETALQDRSHERQQQRIALRHFPVMWNRHPEANEPDPLEPSDPCAPRCAKCGGGPVRFKYCPHCGARPVEKCPPEFANLPDLLAASEAAEPGDEDDQA